LQKREIELFEQIQYTLTVQVSEEVKIFND